MADRDLGGFRAGAVLGLGSKLVHGCKRARKIVTAIDMATGILRAVQIPLGHAKIENTVQ